MHTLTLEYAKAAEAELRTFLAQEREPRGEPINPLRGFNDVREDYQHRRAEGHWFDRDAMRFFATRDAGRGLPLPHLGVTLFVTSERDTYADGARRFSLRAYRWADADITTLGPFCEMTQARAARVLEYLGETFKA